MGLLQANRDQIITMTIKFWSLWPEVKVLQLTINMRIANETDENRKKDISGFVRLNLILDNVNTLDSLTYILLQLYNLLNHVRPTRMLVNKGKLNVKIISRVAEHHYFHPLLNGICCYAT